MSDVTHSAEDGCHDDLGDVYGYLCLGCGTGLLQRDDRPRSGERLYEEDKTQLEEDMSPFGFIQNGVDDEMFVDGGELWKTEWEHERYDKYRDKIDEYGMPMSP